MRKIIINMVAATTVVATAAAARAQQVAFDSSSMDLTYQISPDAPRGVPLPPGPNAIIPLRPATVPEPGSLPLLGVATLPFLGFIRRRNK